MVGLVLATGFIPVFVIALIPGKRSSIHYDRDLCEPLVLAHRGASGYVPEHTLTAFAVAATIGADYLELDIVMTKDGHMIARHDNELGLTTDVSQHPEFASRYRTQSVDGNNIAGWFTEDFTLVEIKTLRAIERIPTIRPGNTRMDLAFEIPTMQEIIGLIKSLEISLKRPIGICPEIKHPTHFQRLGLAMERPLVNLLHDNGYRGPEAPIYIQSFEVNNLKELKKMTDLRLLQLLRASAKHQPFDQWRLGTNLTFGQMATAEGLYQIASYASAVGPDKVLIIPRNADNTLGTVTTFVVDAHAAGLKVHPYTFSSENTYLPTEYRSNSSLTDAMGDGEGEIRAFLDAGIDGFFADQSDDVLRARGSCTNSKTVSGWTENQPPKQRSNTPPQIRRHRRGTPVQTSARSPAATARRYSTRREPPLRWTLRGAPWSAPTRRKVGSRQHSGLHSRAAARAFWRGSPRNNHLHVWRWPEE